MAHWKVIALINGDIEAVSGPAAQGRPGAREWIVWQGPAADKAEAPPMCRENRSQGRPGVDADSIREGTWEALGSLSAPYSPRFLISTPFQQVTGQT